MEPGARSRPGRCRDATAGPAAWLASRGGRRLATGGAPTVVVQLGHPADEGINTAPASIWTATWLGSGAPARSTNRPRCCATRARPVCTCGEILTAKRPARRSCRTDPRDTDRRSFAVPTMWMWLSGAIFGLASTPGRTASRCPPVSRACVLSGGRRRRPRPGSGRRSARPRTSRRARTRTTTASLDDTDPAPGHTRRSGALDQVQPCRGRS